jgi:catechol 2,3-dioxygenase-like lactoylglutathione lyase family enzyme
VPKLDRVIETALYVDDLARARRFYETRSVLPR